MNTQTTVQKPELKTRWHAYRQSNPGVYPRNAAQALGVSEAELVAVSDGSTRLEGSMQEMLRGIEAFGEVMALTRNDACVHEKTGRYQKVSFMDAHHMGLVLDEQIDLRLFMDHLRFAFSVETPWTGSSEGVRRSIQFFDKDGTAVHKVFLTRKSDVPAYEALVERHRTLIDAPLAIEALHPAPAEKPDNAIDKGRLLQAWSELQDTHDFFPMLRTHGVSRTQALRLAEGTFCERVANTSSRQMLERVAESRTPIMVFVGSAGCIQIHTGPVKTVKEQGPWYNVLDPGFNMHLNESLIHSSWVVRKPTKDGTVTSLEVFDAAGELIVQFFGQRKPDLPELAPWREAMVAMPRLA